MKRFLTSYLVLFCALSSANAKVFDSDEHISGFYTLENIVNSGVVIESQSSDPIKVYYANVLVVNNGDIIGDIDVNGNVLNIQNSGNINGDIINSGSGGYIHQIISSDSEFKKLNVIDTSLYVDISNLDNINIDDLSDLNATGLNLNNSEIYIDDFTKWQNMTSFVSFNGNNTFHIEQIGTVQSGDVIKGVINIDNIDVDIKDIDILHKVDLQNTPQGVTLNIIRETNYQNIFSDDRGVVLEEIRRKNPDDKFIKKLDSVHSMSELESLVNSSYHFNHKVLIRPLKIMNNLIMMDFHNNYKNIEFKPGYIGGKKVKGFGASGLIGGNYKNVYIGLGFDADKLKYDNSYDSFDLHVYGPKLKAKIDLDNIWINGVIGFLHADYKASDIYYNGHIKNKTKAFSDYGAMDVGYNFNLSNNLNLNIFAGSVYQYTKTMDIKDKDVYLRFGSNIDYSYEIIGIKYEYSAGAGIATNGDLSGWGKMGFWSIADEAGASIIFDVIDNEYDLNYQMSINVKLMF